MNGMPRSLWSVEFDTYRGASAIDRRILDWHLYRMAILELLAQPHSSMPYVDMGFIATFYTRTLFSRDNGDLLPKSQYSCFNFSPKSGLFPTGLPLPPPPPPPESPLSHLCYIHHRLILTDLTVMFGNEYES